MKCSFFCHLCVKCAVIVHLIILNCGTVLCGRHAPPVSNLQTGAKHQSFCFKCNIYIRTGSQAVYVFFTVPGGPETPPTSLAWAPLWDLELCLDYEAFYCPLNQFCLNVQCADSHHALNCHTIICNDSNQIISYISFDANFSKMGSTSRRHPFFIYCIWSSNVFCFFHQLVLLK